jgi:hypothetical protein
MSSRITEDCICSKPSLLCKLSGKSVQSIMACCHMYAAQVERLQAGVLIQTIRVLGAKGSIIGGLAALQWIATCNASIFLSKQDTQPVLHPHVVIKGINNCVAPQANDRIEGLLIGELEGVQGIPDSNESPRLNLINRHKIPDLSYIC